MFQPYILKWKGEEFQIPPDRLMMAGAVVDDFTTLGDLLGQLQTRDFKLIKIARAYGALLRFAGAKVTDEEVRDGMFKGVTIEPAAVVGSVLGLLQLFLPEDAFQAIATGNPRDRAKPKKKRAARS